LRNDASGEVEERGIHQLALGLEMPEEGDFVDLGRFGDAPGRGAAHSGLRVDPDGSFEQRVPDVHAAWYPILGTPQNASNYLLALLSEKVNQTE
jgi:hypothetical protein